VAGEVSGKSRIPENVDRGAAALVDRCGCSEAGMGHATWSPQPAVAQMLNRSMHPGDSGQTTRPKPTRPVSSANLQRAVLDDGDGRHTRPGGGRQTP